jgi:hypothetical protein
MSLARPTAYFILMTAVFATTMITSQPLMAYAQSPSGTTGGGIIGTPGGIAVDTFGNVFIADATTNSIKKYDTTGRFLSSWGSAGTGAGQFTGPISIATDAAGAVYVLDEGNQRVQKFDGAGNFLAAWGYAPGAIIPTTPGTGGGNATAGGGDGGGAAGGGNATAGGGDGGTP